MSYSIEENLEARLKRAEAERDQLAVDVRMAQERIQRLVEANKELKERPTKEEYARKGIEALNWREIAERAKEDHLRVRDEALKELNECIGDRMVQVKTLYDAAESWQTKAKRYEAALRDACKLARGASEYYQDKWLEERIAECEKALSPEPEAKK